MGTSCKCSFRARRWAEGDNRLGNREDAAEWYDICLQMSTAGYVDRPLHLSLLSVQPLFCIGLCLADSPCSYCLFRTGSCPGSAILILTICYRCLSLISLSFPGTAIALVKVGLSCLWPGSKELYIKFLENVLDTDYHQDQNCNNAYMHQLPGRLWNACLSCCVHVLFIIYSYVLGVCLWNASTKGLSTHFLVAMSTA